MISDHQDKGQKPQRRGYNGTTNTGTSPEVMRQHSIYKKSYFSVGLHHSASAGTQKFHFLISYWVFLVIWCNYILITIIFYILVNKFVCLTTFQFMQRKNNATFDLKTDTFANELNIFSLTLFSVQTLAFSTLWSLCL